MSRDIAVGMALCGIFLVLGIGLGLSEYYDHIENMAKIERGCND